jgi:hypothetical protein
VSQIEAARDEAPDRRVVGVPKAESRLTDAVLRRPQQLIRPGPGRQLLIIDQVEIGIGKPDFLLLKVSPAALEARRKSLPRLANLAEASVLGALRSGDISVSGLSLSRSRSLARRLKSEGWIDRAGNVRRVPNIIGDSLIVEAKISHWPVGISQLARTRRLVNRVALLVPASAIPLIPEAAVKHNVLGLASWNGKTLSWVRDAPSMPLSWTAAMWLTELALRHTE